MILKETLRKVVRSQRDDLKHLDRGITREQLEIIDTNIPFAIVISGIRRCGKSTLLRQVMKKKGQYNYFNFEDPRAVDFDVNDFQKLDEIFKEEHGVCNYYFFDEIQNVSGWERFIPLLLDRKKSVILTGSNASLLSKELATKLTGRHISYELFPFSYNEMLTFTGKEAGISSFEYYLFNGGFPEYLQYRKAEILHELVKDVAIRDIAVRHKLREVKTVKEMAIYLLTNVGKEFSFNKLRKVFNLGSTNSVISYISYFENSYLLFTLPKFDYSLKKQLVNPKKVYTIDNGMSNVNSASFSEDKGRMLENIVFLHLRKKYENVFYFREKNECDFVVKVGANITHAFQVCHTLNEENKERELAGLEEAMKTFGLDEGHILTYDQEDFLEKDGKKIRLIPVWKWLL